MDPELFSTLTHVSYLLGGFFDFVVLVAVIIVALTQIRPAERGLGYAIAALAGSRFLCICGSRSLGASFDPIPFNDMNGVIPIALVLIDFVIPFLTIALWGALLFAVVKIRRRAAS